MKTLFRRSLRIREKYGPVGLNFVTESFYTTQNIEIIKSKIGVEILGKLDKFGPREYENIINFWHQTSSW